MFLKTGSISVTMTNYQVIAREECVAKTVTPQTGSKLVRKKKVFII